MHIEPLPYTILALAPFSPALETEHVPVVHTDTISLDDALAQLSPSLNIAVDKGLCPDGNVAVTIKRMADFKPKNIIRNGSFFKEMNEAETYIKNGGSPFELAVKFPRVAEILTIAPKGASGAAAEKSSAIDDILSMVDSGSDSRGASGSDVQSQIEDIKGKILQTIFADENFRQMESAWRGAKLLATQAPSGTQPTVNLILAPLPKGDCLPVFDMLEGMLADSPPDLIIVDKYLSNSPRAMVEIEKIMNFAQSMLAPVAIALAPKFLEIPDWQQIKSVRFIPALLEGAEYGRWKTLLTDPAAGWTVPCVGAVMGRPLHQPETGFGKAAFSETAPLWINAPWAIGALCARSIAVHSRPTRFADRSSVRLEELPITSSPSPSPLEMLLDTERLKDFKQAGITALAGTSGHDQIFITYALTMDGGPLNFRLFFSQLINFLILCSTTKREEFENMEMDLSKALSLFIQSLGFTAPEDLQIAAKENQDGSTALEISFTPPSEIMSGGNRFSFGFNW